MTEHADESEAVREAILEAADRIEEKRTYLTDLDSAIGDADHGANMARGFGAVAERVEGMDDADPAEIVKTVGTTIISEVGGAAGPLYGGSIMSASTALADGVTAETTVAFAEAYLEKLTDRGGARVGDKTMVDALTPAVHTYKKSIEIDGLPPVEALAKAVDAAERGVAYTVPLRARKGRASYLDWRSVGHQDPGATSTLILAEAILDVAVEHLDGDVERDARDPAVIRAEEEGLDLAEAVEDEPEGAE
ncbi:dihydroxyacetone kinase subunit DhaL [Halorubrum vacuolatum]|uniref:Dihydroxyacetone kinase DhaL subunit n=1 Tax=Halorubrum vacuolatum TaxID=63740 RepID=A0A238W110_HALVU|nr:dihydroxyacetone kinase subunit DhaL [Halorubrum vacuolatum]SNR40242.1 dihydroxyacetone kinase DhaL subunit [Halorubrum vacuolatum]